MIARTIPELKGQSCTTFNDPVTPAKSILLSRSFATVLTKKSIIKHAVIFYVSRAHKRLNRQQLYTRVHVHAMKRYLAHPIKIGCLMR